MSRISLAQQLDEIDRELAQRASVYPRLVSGRKLRQSVANFQVDRLKAARASLQWLADHEDTIKRLMREHAAASASTRLEGTCVPGTHPTEPEQPDADRPRNPA